MSNDVEETWLVETLRTTAFGETSVEHGQTWWSSVVGDEPDTETIKSKLGQYTASTEMFGGILSLEVQPNRTDWLLRAVRPNVVEGLAFPAIDSLDKVAPNFAKLGSAWIGQEPQVNRLAFGAVLFKPVENREHGYEILDKYLPSVDIDADGSLDLFYQINRPRSTLTKVTGLELNRLSKWSALRLAAGNIQFDSDKPTASAATQEAFAVRLELDVNTSDKFTKTLPVNRLDDVFIELLELGSQITELGDVR